MTVDIFHIICRAPVAHAWFLQSDDVLECLASHNQMRLLLVHLGFWLASDLAGLMWSGIETEWIVSCRQAWRPGHDSGLQ